MNNMAMKFLARPPNRASFDVGGYQGYLSLPLSLRDAMLREIENWRVQEGTNKPQAGS